MGAAGLIAMLGLLALGAPIFVAMGAVALTLFHLEGMPLVTAAMQVLGRLDSPAFAAVPFFVIAAVFMQRGGIARVLIEAAEAWVGGVRGGLALVCVLATTIFAAISGSSVATALAMGTFLVPAMAAKRYDRPFALGVVGASATLGILIPPSMPMIVYGIIADESVPQLFLAGVLPGLLLAALFAGWVVFYSRRRHLSGGRRVSRDEFIQLNLRAVPALLIPVVIFAGIYGGITTVGEAAGVVAVLSMLISVFIYKEIKPREVFGVIANGIKSASAITFIVAFALLYAHWVAGSGVPARLVDLVARAELEAWQFLLVINVLMFILGMFLDTIAIILITVPIVLPILDALGIDRIHYCIIVIVNMELAMLTPPIGLNLFVMSSIAKAPLAEVVRGVLPFVILMIGFLVLVTFVPSLSTWLPELVLAK